MNLPFYINKVCWENKSQSAHIYHSTTLGSYRIERQICSFPWNDSHNLHSEIGNELFQMDVVFYAPKIKVWHFRWIKFKLCRTMLSFEGQTETQATWKLTVQSAIQIMESQKIAKLSEMRELLHDSLISKNFVIIFWNFYYFVVKLTSQIRIVNDKRWRMLVLAIKL